MDVKLLVLQNVMVLVESSKLERHYYVCSRDKMLPYNFYVCPNGLLCVLGFVSNKPSVVIGGFLCHNEFKLIVFRKDVFEYVILVCACVTWC